MEAAQASALLATERIKPCQKAGWLAGWSAEQSGLVLSSFLCDIDETPSVRHRHYCRIVPYDLGQKGEGKKKIQ